MLKKKEFQCVFSYRVRADGGTCLLRETINVVIRPVKQARIKASISGFQNKTFASQTLRGFQNVFLAKFRRDLF